MRERTDFLRGLAILGIMLGHWFKPAFPAGEIIGGNGLVAIFFFLSGYGIFHSLDKAPGAGLAPKALGIFYLKRIKRLYPLFWLVVGLRFALSPSTRAEISVLTVLGLDFTAPPTLWFVPAIVQCYLAAPLLYLASRRLAPAASVAAALACVALLQAAGPALGIPHVRVWYYREVVFGGPLLFHLGLVYASVRNRSAGAWSGLAPLLWGVLFAAAIVRQRYLDPDAGLAGLPLDLTLHLAAAMFCIAVLQSTVRLPLARLLVPMGAASYGLYLTHPLFFSMVRRLPGSIWPDTAAMFLLLPLFVLGARLLERHVGFEGAAALWRRLAGRKPKGAPQ